MHDNDLEANTERDVFKKYRKMSDGDLVPAIESSIETIIERRSVVVTIDSIDAEGIRGWGYNEDDPHNPTEILVFVDQEPVGVARCELVREDVRAAGHPSERVGFSFPIPNKYMDDIEHAVQLRTTTGAPVRLLGPGNNLWIAATFRLPPLAFRGWIDGYINGAVRGWAFAYDRSSDTHRGELQILVTLQGQPIGQVTANQFRPDVAEAHGATPNSGFVFVPPRELLGGGKAELRFQIIPGAVELENSPYVVALPELETVRKARDLAAVADGILAQLWKLRTQLKGLTTTAQENLTTYDSWAREYFARLAAAPSRFTADSESLDLPLVSVTCPVYRPRLRDFMAAVELIIAQTYKNWELILVDDGSAQPELDACLKSFAARDPRIRAKSHSKNRGISAATNTALLTANGEYVAFFDHDDLMEPRAIEYMVEAARRTNAKLLYCDEDKIDDSGLLSEVNLKPDWNYRLLLAQNYVCHLLFVDREQLRKVGPLRSVCDGAQDHDLILRLAEITPPEQIRHVPEILYHWRKTPSSTAASGRLKPYAVQAGIRAISTHLKKKGQKGKVTSLLETTLFAIEWDLPREPDVTIIVPYREHVAMTNECVEAIRTLTDYTNYEIVLVDNWSTSDEALAFAKQQAQIAGTRVMRVEEPFNFSRINNIAAASARSEYILFLNNDVIVQSPSWLRQMIGEALSDLRIGAVGNKLVYPNRLVQHGGVILGVGGIADHAHRGIPGDSPGYMARAISAQDLSAVTAASLLCPRAVFEEVGGFDEAELKVAYNDVDLCLKMRAAGYRVIWTPNPVAEHREGVSRGDDFKPEHLTRFIHENQVMRARWSDHLDNDPHYNPQFAQDWGIFSDLRTIS